MLVYGFFVLAVQGERHDIKDSDLAVNLFVGIGYHSLNGPDGCTVIQLKSGIEFFDTESGSRRQAKDVRIGTEGRENLFPAVFGQDFGL